MAGRCPPECPEVCAHGVPLGPENAPGGGVCMKVWDSQCEHANMPPPPLSGGTHCWPIKCDTCRDAFPAQSPHCESHTRCGTHLCPKEASNADPGNPRKRLCIAYVGVWFCRDKKGVRGFRERAGMQTCPRSVTPAHTEALGRTAAVRDSPGRGPARGPRLAGWG